MKHGENEIAIKTPADNGRFGATAAAIPLFPKILYLIACKPININPDLAQFSQAQPVTDKTKKNAENE